MLKYFLIALNVAVGIFYLFTGGVVLSVEAPTEVNPGSSFIVTVNIHPGDLSNFVRFQQELPMGLTASELESTGGMFSFKDQKVKILWMVGSFPPEDFVIQYEVKVDPTYQGTIELCGEIAYADETGLRNIIPGAPCASIQVGPVDPDIHKIDPKDPPDTTNLVDYTQPFFTKTIEMLDSKTAMVTVVMKTKGLGEYGQYKDWLCPGCTAEGVTPLPDGIMFKVDGNDVKFLWTNLPADPEITFQYKVHAGPDGNLYELHGKPGEIITTDKNNNTLHLNGKTVDDNQAKFLADAVKAGYKPKKDPKDPKDPKDHGTHDTARNWTNPGTPKVIDFEGEQGVRYRVQICALTEYKSAGRVKSIRKYGLHDQVFATTDRGWYKYMAGAFALYYDARDFRESVWTTSEATDAFVAAYNNGVRITVQEAMMHSVENWPL